MPRRHRSARDRTANADPPARPLGAAPAWAEREGVRVQAVSGQSGKPYRCPGCQQLIALGMPHLVVVEDGDLEGRRHWHTPCWRGALNRRR